MFVGRQQGVPCSDDELVPMKYRVFEVIDIALPGEFVLLKAADDTAAIALAKRFLNGELQIWLGRRFVGTINATDPSDQDNRTEIRTAFSEELA